MSKEKFVLPEPPERPNITVVPAWQARRLLPEGRNFGWQLTEDGLVNPRFGAFRRYAQVEVDQDGNPIKFHYDLVLWDDGPIDPETGLATPGMVVVPIEKKEGEYFVRCSWQWRPAIYDQETGEQGVWTLSVPGGFADFVGETPEAVAKREAREEGALHLLNWKKLGHSSANRANTRTCVNFGYALFEVVEGEKLTESDEKLYGSFAVPLVDFPITRDKLINEAVWATQKALGLIRPRPNKGFIAKLIEELSSLIE
jgi:ADP-ribose pyrophosphatase YjhB (NUDIX family)